MEPQELVVDLNSLRLPPVTLVVTLGIILGAALGALLPPELIQYFVLHPVSIMPPKFWVTTILSYPFIDLSLFNAFISLVSFPVFGKVIENLYGPVALIRLLFVVIVCTGVGVVLFGLVEPLLLTDVEKWSRIPASAYFGFQPGLMACFVALKQAMPETEIAIFFLFRIKLNTLPLFAMCLTLTVCIIAPARGAFAMVLAWPIAWGYLRFFSTMYNQTLPGDMRDSFSLASFFPPQVQPYILPLSRWIDNRKIWPSVSVTSDGPGGSLLPVKSELETRILATLPMTAAARENRAVATELVNERLESLERKGNELHDTNFDLDDSFVDISPIKPQEKKH